MQRLILGLTLLFFMFTSCKRQVPEGLLSEKEIINLLTDVHVLDGYISSLPADSAKKVIDPLYAELFLKYNLDSNSFGENIDYYYGDPNLTVKTYDQVIKNLEKQEKQYITTDSLLNANRQDSINRNMRMKSRVLAIKDMIINALADSAKLTIADYTKRMYSHSPIEHLWDRNILKIPINLDTTSQKRKIKPVDDTQNTKKVDTTVDNSDTIQAVKELVNPPKLRKKPVLKPKDRPMIVQ